MKSSYKNIFFALIGIVGFGGLYLLSDWHPLNLLFGPQYNFKSIGKSIGLTLSSADSHPDAVEQTKPKPKKSLSSTDSSKKWMNCGNAFLVAFRI